MSELVVSALQMLSGGDIAANMQTVRELVKRAAEQEGASLLVLPENFLAMTSASQAELSTRIPEVLSVLQDLARSFGVNLVAGSLPVPVGFSLKTNSCTEAEAAGARYRSASFLISSEGNILARYDKIHLFDVDVGDRYGSYRESDTYQAGNAIQVVDMGSYKLGMSICYDLRFPELFQKLVTAGADVVVLPAAFTRVTGQAHWEILLRARAIETQCFLIAADQGGRHDSKRETWGHSMIIDPWGSVLAQCETGKTIVTARLDFQHLQEIRTSMPVSSHRREFEV